MILEPGRGFYAPTIRWEAKPHARITEARYARERRFRVGVRRLDQAK